MRRPALSPGALWHRLWFAEFDPLSVGMFRISLGVLILLTLVALLPSWDFFFSPHGITELPSGHEAGLQEKASLFYWTNPHVPPRVLAWLGILVACGFIVGFLTRACTIFLYVLISSMIHYCPSSINGEDLVYRVTLLYACFAPLGHTLSVDSWLRHRAGKTLPAPAIWPVRLMQINIALIYVFTQTRKMFGDVVWMNGDAMYYTVANTTWSRWPWPMLFTSSLVTKASSWGSLVVEAAFPLLVWFRPFRLIVVGALAAVHIGIAIALQNVTFFSLSMVAALWVFVPAEDTRRLGRWMALRGGLVAG